MRLTAETVFLGAVGVIMVAALIGGGQSGITGNVVLEGTPASIPWFLLGILPLIAITTLHLARHHHARTPAAQTLEATIKHAPVSAVGREFPIPHDIQKILELHPDEHVRTSIRQAIQRFNDAYQTAIAATEATDLTEKERLYGTALDILSASEQEARQHALSLTPTQIGHLAKVVDKELHHARETEIIIGLNQLWQRALEIPAEPHHGTELIKEIIAQEHKIAQAAKEQKIDVRSYASIAKETRREIGNAVERLAAPLLVDAGATAEIAAEDPQGNIALALKARDAHKAAADILLAGEEYLPTSAVRDLETHVKKSTEDVRTKAIEWRKGELIAKARLGILDPKRLQEYRALTDQQTDVQFIQRYLQTYREAGGDPSALLSTITYDADRIREYRKIEKRGDKEDLKEHSATIFDDDFLDPYRRKRYRREKQRQKDERLTFPERLELDKEKTWNNEQVARLMQSKLRQILMQTRGEEKYWQIKEKTEYFIRDIRSYATASQKDTAERVGAEIEMHIWESYVENQLVRLERGKEGQWTPEQLVWMAKTHKAYDRFKDRFDALIPKDPQEQRRAA